MMLVKKACAVVAAAEQELASAHDEELGAVELLVEADRELERLRDIALAGAPDPDGNPDIGIAEEEVQEVAWMFAQEDVEERRDAHGVAMSRLNRAREVLHRAQLARLTALGADLPAADVELMALYPPPPPPPLD